MINYIFAPLIVAVIFLIIAVILNGEISKIKVLALIVYALFFIQVLLAIVFTNTQWIKKPDYDTAFHIIFLIEISILIEVVLEACKAYYENKRK